MNNIKKFELCNKEDDSIITIVEAEISSNQLTIFGKEQCKSNDNCDCFDYTFCFDERNTNRMFEIIDFNEFKKLFSGINGTTNLRSFCIAYDIHFSSIFI